MSHFLFGVVEAMESPRRQSIGDDLEVCWGTSMQQAVVIEMLSDAGKPSSQETPFSVTRRGEDTADALVSPYQVDRARAVETLNAVLSWLHAARGGKGAELWITEGYDDAFRELRGSCEELCRIATAELLQNDVVPSLRLVILG